MYRHSDRLIFACAWWIFIDFSQMIWSWWFHRTCRLPSLSRLVGKGRYDWLIWWHLVPWWYCKDPKFFLWFWLSSSLQEGWAQIWCRITWVFSWWCLGILGCTFHDTGEIRWKSCFLRGRAVLSQVLVIIFSSDQYHRYPKVFLFCSF